MLHTFTNKTSVSIRTESYLTQRKNIWYLSTLIIIVSRVWDFTKLRLINYVSYLLTVQQYISIISICWTWWEFDCDNYLYCFITALPQKAANWMQTMYVYNIGKKPTPLRLSHFAVKWWMKNVDEKPWVPARSPHQHIWVFEHLPYKMTLTMCISGRSWK